MKENRIAIWRAVVETRIAEHQTLTHTSKANILLIIFNVLIAYNTAPKNGAWQERNYTQIKAMC
jgi:hypothetical protein